MAVHVVRLCRPEEQDAEEISTGDRGDNQSQGQDPWVLLEARGEYRILCALDLPNTECSEKNNSKYEWC